MSVATIKWNTLSVIFQLGFHNPYVLIKSLCYIHISFNSVIKNLEGFLETPSLCPWSAT